MCDFGNCKEKGIIPAIMVMETPVGKFIVRVRVCGACWTENNVYSLKDEMMVYQEITNERRANLAYLN